MIIARMVAPEFCFVCIVFSSSLGKKRTHLNLGKFERNHTASPRRSLCVSHATPAEKNQEIFIEKCKQCVRHEVMSALGEAFFGLRAFVNSVAPKPAPSPELKERLVLAKYGWRL